MRKIDPEKLAKLSTANSMLDEKYGAPGTTTREQFNEESSRGSMATCSASVARN